MSHGIDIFGMLNKAQNEYNQQQNSVAAFFQQASSNNGGAVNNAQNRSMPVPIKSLSSLEQIERQIRTSPPRKIYFPKQATYVYINRITL